MCQNCKKIPEEILIELQKEASKNLDKAKNVEEKKAIIIAKFGLMVIDKHFQENANFKNIPRNRTKNISKRNRDIFKS